MDKETLSNYGWIVICVLVLAVMIALATPFGHFVAGAIKSTTAGLFDVNQGALNAAGITIDGQGFADGGNGNGSNGSSGLDMSTVSSTLAENDWATIQKVTQAGKIAEAGWSVGDTKDLTINGTTYNATLIGIDHDGENTATFMIANPGGIGKNIMKRNGNDGGWEESVMREWLNSDVYNTMSNKDYIKEVTKMTNNVGYQGDSATGTSDKVFLLSPKETGIEWQVADYWGKPMNALNSEGTTYAWFESNTVAGQFWLRSPLSHHNSHFYYYDKGDLFQATTDVEKTACPAFVIG